MEPRLAYLEYWSKDVPSTIPLSPRKFAERGCHHAFAAGRGGQTARRRPEPHSADEAALREPASLGGFELRSPNWLHQGGGWRGSIWSSDSAFRHRRFLRR